MLLEIRKGCLFPLLYKEGTMLECLHPASGVVITDYYCLPTAIVVHLINISLRQSAL